jgi:hypothetical protein
MNNTLLALSAALLVAGAARAADPVPPVFTNETAHLPGLTIRSGAQKCVEAAGTLCLTNGILEFVAVEAKSREYESLVALTAKPAALKFALLLIGCEAGDIQPPGQNPPTPPRVGKNPGAALGIEVAWQQDGKERCVPVEQLLVSRKTKKPVAGLRWRFTGAYFTKDFAGHEIFIADAEQAFISLWFNPAIVINLADDHGNPYRGDDQGFEVNSAAVPALGTPVRLILRPAP